MKREKRNPCPKPHFIEEAICSCSDLLEAMNSHPSSAPKVSGGINFMS
jgi:hypothetical protein